MATNPIGGSPSPVIHPNRFPPAAAARVAQRMLARFNRNELGNAIEVLVELLDACDGDPDEETDDPDLEAAGDENDAAWIEWHTMRGSQKRGPNILATRNEDDEDDDPAEEDDPSGQCDEDGVNTGNTIGLFGDGPGCGIADSGIGDDDGLAEAHGELMPGEYRIDQSAGVVPYDFHGAHKMMRVHRDRIRRTRCDHLVYRNPYTHRDHVEFRLTYL